MPHCLLQTDTTAPPVDQLKRAIKLVKTFTEADAIKLAVEADGILIKNLSFEDASEVQRALEAEGVRTEILDAAGLPRLANAKFVRRMGIQPDALVVYDPLGRAVPVSWQRIDIFSAGTVRHFGMSATRTEKKTTSFDPIRGIHTKMVTEVRHKVEDDAKFILDIILSGGLLRFQIEADAFQFKHCFDRPEFNLPQKVSLLIQLLVERAPQAALNRGATALRDGLPGNATYVSKAALFNESVWLLWRLAKKGQEHA